MANGQTEKKAEPKLVGAELFKKAVDANGDHYHPNRLPNVDESVYTEEDIKAAQERAAQI